MTYFEELRPASFGGIEFEAFVSTDGGGRRGKVNQFPKSDDASFNDRGGKTKPFILRASVFGADALTQADNLADRLNREGFQRLVHPILGEMRATCTDWVRRSTADSGHRVNFNIEFFKEPERKTGVKVSQNSQKAAEEKEIQTNIDSATIFENTFQIEGQPAFIFDEAKKDLEKMTSAITGFLGDTQTEIAEFTSNLDSLINEPFKLIQAMQDLIGATVRAASFSNVGIRSRTSAASNAFDNSQQLNQFSTGFESIPVTTTTRAIQQSNSAAIQLSVRLSATVVEAELHRGDEGLTLFATREQAQQQLKQLLQQMQIRKNESSDISSTISQLMAATATASNAKYGILADEKTIEIQVDTNTMLLAYELYDDYIREDEIRSRNNLTDTFVKKGTVLKVSEN